MSDVRPAGRCACAFPSWHCLGRASPETLPLPPTEVARVLEKRAHKSHALTLVQKLVSLRPCTCGPWPWLGFRVKSSAGMGWAGTLWAGLQASLRLVSAQPDSGRPLSNGYSFNCHLSCVSGTHTRKVRPSLGSESRRHLCPFYGLLLRKALLNWHYNGSTSQQRY